MRALSSAARALRLQSGAARALPSTRICPLASASASLAAARRSVVTVSATKSSAVNADGDGEDLGSLAIKGGANMAADKNASDELLPRSAYLDLQATTPLDPRVLDAMMPFFVERYGNPHSRTHAYGWEAEQAIENARAQVASLIGADPKEIIFTSGATESNNMAIKGVAKFYKDKKKHVITTQTEHKCVLDSCRYLESEGFRVTYLPVQTNGLVDLKELEAAITPETALVSVMGVNNEIGVVQPLAEIGKLCRSKKVFFHTDAAQMVGKVPLNVDEMNIDLMSISGHKVYGPKGIGAIYIRRKPRVRLEPLISGGGQERGLRSGTLPHPLIVGLGAACDVAKKEMDSDSQWIKHLSRRLIDGIRAKIPAVILNGDEEQRYLGNVNFSFAYVEGESLLMALKNLAVSSGSACTSASLEPSYGELNAIITAAVSSCERLL
jgi:cysteine desulfurase